MTGELYGGQAKYAGRGFSTREQKRKDHDGFSAKIQTLKRGRTVWKGEIRRNHWVFIINERKREEKAD